MSGSIILNFMVILVCVFFIVINRINKHSYRSIVQIQNIMWLLAFVIYLTGIIKYYEFYPPVYICVFGYIIAFNLACYKNTMNVCISINDELVTSVADKKKSNRCIWASAVTWGLSLGILQKTILVLVNYGLSAGLNILRYKAYIENSMFSTMEICLITYIMRPIFVVTIILFAQQVSLRKVNIKLAIAAIIDAFMLVLLTAGRSMLVSLVIYVFFAVIFVNGTNILKLIKKYRKYLIPMLVLIIAIAYISSMRVGQDRDMLTEMAIYLFSGVPYFSGMLKNDMIKPFVFWGRGILSPIFETPLLLLRLLGVNIEAATQVMSHITKQSLMIGENVGINATASTLLVFYADFGYLGPIIAGIALGKFATSCERKLSLNSSSLNYAKYLFLVGAFFASVQNYQLSGVATFMTWVLICILLK